jgi:hypothetical protein
MWNEGMTTLSLRLAVLFLLLLGHSLQLAPQELVLVFDGLLFSPHCGTVFQGHFQFGS